MIAKKPPGHKAGPSKALALGPKMRYNKKLLIYRYFASNDRGFTMGGKEIDLERIEPDFDKAGGLVPAVAQDAATGEILMLAYMNREAFDRTLATGEAHYWSRSRRVLWHKGGGRSGRVQKVRELRLDCDLDTVLLKIEQVGGISCHTGRRTCFHYLLGPDGRFRLAED